MNENINTCKYHIFLEILAKAPTLKDQSKVFHAFPQNMGIASLEGHQTVLLS